MKYGLVLLFLALSSGCMSTQIQYDEKWNKRVAPVYVDYFDYYFLGLVGQPTLSLQKICMDQKPYGVRRRKTAEDGLITLVTVGIYSPATVEVWCGE